MWQKNGVGELLFLASFESNEYLKGHYHAFAHARESPVFSPKTIELSLWRDKFSMRDPFFHHYI